jgi:2-keto-4-pentenoate hydratase/2-oxohepta-3-ene-1,7-dioic acid hydratase in catechol pathway
MKLVTFAAGGATRIGAVLGEEVVAFQPALDALGGGSLPGTMRGLLAAGEAAMVQAARALAFAARPENAALRQPLGAVRLRAPLLPGKILGVGRNYADHATEVGGPKLAAPRIFLKPTSSVSGPGDTVRIPALVEKCDWEVELAVVIGKPARAVSEGEALDHVAGYTVLNDLTDRALQFDHPIGMTSFGKGLDGFCPMGPWIATAEEVGEPWALDLRCFVNDEEVQHGNTRDLIFPVATLIAWLSRYVTLEPGDVIATGTPAGVGHFRKPPRYLRPGDRLRLEVEKVGVLEHRMGGA